MRRQYERFLPLVEKPARYLGTEHGAIYKDPRAVSVHLALAFPDVYEIGQSHLGLQILYQVLNRDRRFYAERVFAPWPDMERQLRARSLPLVSLETATPLRDFHIVGFSLQYELTYTNILAMLDLGGIPIYSFERTASQPLVIAGGPCAFNPEPLAPFLDAVLVGDGEEGAVEICEAYLAWDGRDRYALLESLRRIAGVYVPLLCPAEPAGRLGFVCAPPRGTHAGTVRKRVLSDLGKAPPVAAQIVPLVRTVHNRANVEVMRGCVKGCRFCQAGYIYRPLRERSPSSVIGRASELLGNTGHDEVSLLSLSTGDYSCLEGVLEALLARIADRGVAASLPSTRVDALRPDLVRQLAAVRNTGVTLAPEAGTERLRRVIQKEYTEEQLLDAAARLFAHGWRRLKLYFMIGLPTETDEDLEGIAKLCARVKTVAGRRANVTASVSTFVPKPHTPFQWMEQIGLEETRRRQHYLAKRLARLGIRFRWHDPRQSHLEGILARGDRSLAPVIEGAYRLGCRFDAWTDQLRLDLWREALSLCDVGPDRFLGARWTEDPLPWDHIEAGVSKGFLLRELEAALGEMRTPDCAVERCSHCGVCDFVTIRNVVYAPKAAKGTERRWEPPLEKPKPGRLTGATSKKPVQRIRLAHLKVGWARFLGNLDLVATILQALRRAELPLALSAGHRPAPLLSPGPALALGVESLGEFLDLWFYRPLPPTEAARRLNRELPEELRVVEALDVPLSSPSIESQVEAFVYEVDTADLCATGVAEEKLLELVEAFRQADTWPVLKTTKGKTQTIDAKESCELRWPEGERKLIAQLGLAGAKGARLLPLLASVLRLSPAELAFLRVTKIETLLSPAMPSLPRGAAARS